MIFSSESGWTPIGSGFLVGSRSGDALLTLKVWLCANHKCSIIGVDNFLFGNDGLERRYFGLLKGDLRFERVFIQFRFMILHELGTLQWAEWTF